MGMPPKSTVVSLMLDPDPRRNQTQQREDRKALWMLVRARVGAGVFMCAWTCVSVYVYMGLCMQGCVCVCTCVCTYGMHLCIVCECMFMYACVGITHEFCMCMCVCGLPIPRHPWRARMEGTRSLFGEAKQSRRPAGARRVGRAWWAVM